MTKERLITILAGNSDITTNELLAEITKISDKAVSIDDFNTLLKCANGMIPNMDPITYHKNINRAHVLLQNISNNIIAKLKIELGITMLTDKNGSVIKIY